jgi:hypothetical protein
MTQSMNCSSIVKLLLFPLFVFGQSAFNSSVEIHSINPDSVSISIPLAKTFVISSTIRIKADSVSIFNFEYLHRTNSVNIRDIPAGATSISVTYQFLPAIPSPAYSLRSLISYRDTALTQKPGADFRRTELTMTELFGPELTKSGSINRGFYAGSNRDLTLTSGFRLQMVGKLSDDIDIVAALTDENTPIQPQGNTQTLQEIDNVFIEIRGRRYTATVGDFEYRSSAGEFFSVQRKLQGARLSAVYPSLLSGTNFTLTGATARGKFTTKQFPGIEEVQGPYRLTGKNNERNIIIIAGSEKVFVDGVLMVRGETNDYTIDYGSAEVTFTTRRMITGVSRITIDYEYSDRQYTRNIVGINASTAITNSLTLAANYFREGDDPDAPIDLILNDDDRSLLSRTGTNAATKTGVFEVGIDSNGIGRGNYLRIDTVVNSSAMQIYRFEPGTSGSIYNVAFSFVGQGNGEYNRQGVGRYVFVGMNTGQYSPIIAIPAPQLQQNISVQSRYMIGKIFSIDGEVASSSSDVNRFSSIGDNTNTGNAYKIFMKFTPGNLSIADIRVGTMDLSFYQRFTDSQYSTIDRLKDVEYGRKWGTDSIRTTTAVSEEIREGRISYFPFDSLNILGSIGTLERGDRYSSLRYDVGMDYRQVMYPSVSYYTERIVGESPSEDMYNDWFRHKGAAEYTYKSITGVMRIEEEQRSVTNIRGDSLLPASYQFKAYIPKISISGWHGVDAISEFEFRNDDAVSIGRLTRQSSSFTQSYSITLREINSFSFSSLITFRERTYRPEFQSTNTNSQTSLMRMQSRYRPFKSGIDIDAFYDVSTQRTAALERVFFKVRKGEGQYVWIDANNNGIVDLADESEFRPDRFDGEYIAIIVNSDVLRPIINLKASTRFRIIPSRIFERNDGLFQPFISAFSFETYVRIEERSTETDTRSIYLLNPHSLLRPSTTLYGLQFIQQDLLLFENKPDYSFRMRFNQRNGLSQFSSGLERNYSRERSLRMRFQIGNDLFNQTDLLAKDDNAISTSLLNPSRQISSIGIITDLSYKPALNVEIGIKLETSQSEDRPGSAPVMANFNGQSIRYIYGFQGNGQLRSELTREEVLLMNEPVGYRRPYELTSGREMGKQYLWMIASEYRIAGNIQFSLQYSGRTTTKFGIVHTGRMEVRAFF